MAKKAARRCPMCHRASEPYAHNCRCGYQFGQSVEKAIELLEDQRLNLRIGLAILGGMSFVATFVVVFMLKLGLVLHSTIPFAFLLLATIRTGQKLALTNTSLRQLTARKLPEARLLEPRDKAK